MSRGDRVRRVRRARVWLGRAVPPALAAAALIAAGALFTGAPRWLGVACLSAVGGAALVRLGLAWRGGPVTAQAAADLDARAALGGVAVSAHWFVSGCAGAPEGNRADTYGSALLELHLRRAAEAMAVVDWQRVYERPADFWRWTLSAVLAGVTGVLCFVPNRPAPARELVVGQAAGDAGLPAALVPQVVEGVSAMTRGRGPSDESLAAIGQALRLAEDDANVRAELEELLAELQRRGGDLSRSGDAAYSPWETGEAEDYSGYLSRASLQWAYDDAVSRAKGVDAEVRSSPQPGQTPNRVTPNVVSAESNPDAARLSPSAQGGNPEGQPVIADTRGQSESFSSLLFGRQGASDTSGRSSLQAGNPERSLALIKTLRSEIVHAQVNAMDANEAVSGPRHATTTNDPPTAARRVRAVERFDSGVRWQPPIVPDSRRSLVRSFFARAAEPAASRP